MHVFAVRHRTTGRLLPQEFIRGGTYWDPNEESSGPPRLFYSERSARGFIIAWARGLAKTHYGESGASPFEPPEVVSSGVTYEDQGRSRDELEVVKFRLTEETA